MAVMTRESWTDRLDDLSKRVGKLENRMDAGFAGAIATILLTQG